MSDGVLLNPYRHATAAPFVPTDLTNLHEWFKADGPLYQDTGTSTPATANDDPVGNWVDSGPGGRNAIQATAGSRPLLKTSGGPNGKPYIWGDGSNDHLAATPSSWTGGITWFFVYKFHSITNCYAYNLTSAGGGIIVGWEASGQVEHYGSSPRVNCGTSDTTNWAVYEFHDAGTGAASSAQGLKNGTVTETATGASNTFNRARIFVDHLTTCAPVDIAEVVIYSEDKNSTDRGLVRAYLGAKYAITVV